MEKRSTHEKNDDKTPAISLSGKTPWGNCPPIAWLWSCPETEKLYKDGLPHVGFSFKMDPEQSIETVFGQQDSVFSYVEDSDYEPDERDLSFTKESSFHSDDSEGDWLPGENSGDSFDDERDFS